MSVGFFFSLGHFAVVFVTLFRVEESVVGLFVTTWAVTLMVWRFGRIEEKWTARLQQPEPVG